MGSDTISVAYSGAANFSSSTATVVQTVSKAATKIAVVGQPSPSTVGQSVTFTATVRATSPGSGTPGGTVTFKDGTTTLGTVTLDGSGTATFSTSALTAGSQTITVSYSGSASFDASSGSTQQRVNASKSVATSVTSRIQDAALLALLGEGDSASRKAVPSDAPGTFRAGSAGVMISFMGRMHSVSRQDPVVHARGRSRAMLDRWIGDLEA